MKYFVLIFSMYLIILGLMPCQDREDMAATTYAQANVRSESSNKQHFNEESCPPFCSCACCSVGQHFPSEKTVLLTLPVMKKPYPGFYASALKQQPVDVWQPPKLV